MDTTLSKKMPVFLVSRCRRVADYVIAIGLAVTLQAAGKDASRDAVERVLRDTALVELRGRGSRRTR